MYRAIVADTMTLQRVVVIKVCNRHKEKCSLSCDPKLPVSIA